MDTGRWATATAPSCYPLQLVDEAQQELGIVAGRDGSMEQLMQEKGISRIWCGHYPYLKKSLPLGYIQTQKKLARRLADGDQEGSQPYDNPAIPQPPTTRSLSDGICKVVYDVRNIGR